ncbi:hypothetical protein [Peribacillus sp. Bi134]|nr:hypothetical protein [Peribacillus sp. Bi134]
MRLLGLKGKWIGDGGIRGWSIRQILQAFGLYLPDRVMLLF